MFRRDPVLERLRHWALSVGRWTFGDFRLSPVTYRTSVVTSLRLVALTQCKCPHRPFPDGASHSRALCRDCGKVGPFSGTRPSCCSCSWIRNFVAVPLIPEAASCRG